jgi:hypothetical protein
VINVLLNLSLIVLFALGKLALPRIPIWLLIVNFLFFILQAIFIITSTQ